MYMNEVIDTILFHYFGGATLFWTPNENKQIGTAWTTDKAEMFATINANPGNVITLDFDGTFDEEVEKTAKQICDKCGYRAEKTDEFNSSIKANMCRRTLFILVRL
jgi:hypothetical protein